MSTGTVKLHRVIKASPECIYKAFTHADALAKWLPPHGFVGRVLELNPVVGGSHKMYFTHLSTGQSHSFGGEYIELIENERLKYTDRFDDPNLSGEMQTTISLKSVAVGTELHVTQEGIPASIPLEACYLGWQESLLLLAQLVEAQVG